MCLGCLVLASASVLLVWQFVCDVLLYIYIYFYRCQIRFDMIRYYCCNMSCRYAGPDDCNKVANKFVLFDDTCNLFWILL